MAKRYVAVSASTQVESSSGSGRVNSLIYTIPQGATAKLTFVNSRTVSGTGGSPELSVSTDGGTTIISIGGLTARTIDMNSATTRISDFGIYFKSGDMIYLTASTSSSSSYIVSCYLCLILEYDS